MECLNIFQLMEIKSTHSYQGFNSFNKTIQDKSFFIGGEKYLPESTKTLLRYCISLLLFSIPMIICRLQFDYKII